MPEQMIPTELPPNGGTGTLTAGAARPQELSERELAAVSAGGVGQARPTQPPSGAAAVKEVEGIAGLWQSGVHVNMLWSINQDRNAWMSIENVGWKKLSTASPTGIVSLAALAAHARQLQSSVSYREEADGMVHELYVW
jgi:hypothetical protein